MGIFNSFIGGMYPASDEKNEESILDESGVPDPTTFNRMQNMGMPGIAQLGEALFDAGRRGDMGGALQGGMSGMFGGQGGGQPPPAPGGMQNLQSALAQSPMTGTGIGAPGVGDQSIQVDEMQQAIGDTSKTPYDPTLDERKKKMQALFGMATGGMGMPGMM